MQAAARNQTPPNTITQWLSPHTTRTGAASTLAAAYMRTQTRCVSASKVSNDTTDVQQVQAGHTQAKLHLSTSQPHTVPAHCVAAKDAHLRTAKLHLQHR